MSATTVIINEPERSKLYKRIRNLLGAPLRGVELDDEMMDSLLKTCLRKDLFHTMYSTHNVDEIVKAYDIDAESCYDISLVEKIISNWCKEIEEKSLLLEF